MNYRVRRKGEDLGFFPLEELRRRRETGEFTGGEYVQREGMTDWQALDLVLQQGYRVMPPRVPGAVSSGGPAPAIIWTIVGVAVVIVLLVLTGFGYFIARIQREMAINVDGIRNNAALNEMNPQAVATAGEPIVWTTNSQTYLDVQRREREFRLRQWVDGYELRGIRNPACEAEADLFLRTVIACDYGGPEATNTMSLDDEADKLGNNSNCTDPLVLTMAAESSMNQFDAIDRLNRALAAYPSSSHKAYPRLCAIVRLAGMLGGSSDRGGQLQTEALAQLSKCFTDGSFTPADQRSVGEIFVSGWGYNIFRAKGNSVCQIVDHAGPDYHWLALVLDGENEINQAWAARGSGYSDAVTDEGWRGFNSHLASARADLTAAWNLHPDWPLAPDRMITVSLGNGGLAAMRLWFDRTTQAQIDYPDAWSEMRWGLRPRWYGNEKAMLALGVAAINTGRFDTDVPRKYMDCIGDVESEMGLPVGQHIYGRKDIWPNLERMYDGYVNAPSQKQFRNGWRTSYAVVAYLAGKYHAARVQLEALNWEPLPVKMDGWGVDLSLMPLEVAARTGPLGKEIAAAERARAQDNIRGALKSYQKLNGKPDADARTRQFIQCRLDELTAENKLQKGEWISLLPARDNDPDWVYRFGKAHVLPGGALEVESGPRGHMLFPRIRAGSNFEVRGQFEVAHSANKNFQGGLVMGLPDFDGYDWYGFRLKRNNREGNAQDWEGDQVCFAEGWTRSQIARHLVLNDVTNSFDFSLQDGKVTASVNGVKVFGQAAPPVTISVPKNSYLVGLGAFNDSPDTIIRYRNVQLRKL